jgi:FKBP-type peptidyl-prolyl cis-trans isomerase FkpA
MKQTLFAFAIAALMASCGGSMGYEKTNTGLEYKIFSEGKGEKLKPGEIVKFNFITTVKDSVIFSSYGYWPGYVLIDSASKRHDITDILTMLKVGDSAVVLQNYDSLAVYAYQAPEYMKKGDKQKIAIRVLGVFKDEMSAVQDRTKTIEDFTKSESNQLGEYLKKKNINAQKVGQGTYVVIENPGTGPACDSGMLISVNYSGYTLDGKFFDSNTDTTRQTMRHDLTPFQFIAKSEGAIQGMLEGITVFKKGGKGKLFIPSMLAYGPQGSAPAIKRFENIAFDIEVVDVQPAPARPAAPMMPQQSPH